MGVENNEYQIPNLVLGDTFNEWLTVTNSSIIAKLNNMTAYGVTGATGINVDTNSSGLAEVYLDDTISQGITFTGNIIFNGAVTTINSTNLTIDDYNLVLGDTDGHAGTADANINAGGGGGIIINRLSSVEDASLLWKGMTTASGSQTFADLGVGCQGAWTSTDYINLTGGVGLKSTDDTLRFKIGPNATGAGLMTKSIGTAGGPHMAVDVVVYDSESIRMSHMGTGSVGNSAGIFFDSDGMVRIYDGVNKKRFVQSGHGFTFGNVVRLGAGGTCQFAHGNAEADAEVLGMVSEVPNADEFVITMQGEVRGDFGAALGNASSTLSAGAVYFLSGSAGNSGEITSTEPNTAGKIRKPMVIGFGATSGYVLSYIGAKIAADADSLVPMMRRISITGDGDKVSGNSDLTCHNVATGRYGITHSFGTLEYSISVTPWSNGSTSCYGNISHKAANYCIVNVFTGITAAAIPVEVILAKVV